MAEEITTFVSNLRLDEEEEQILDFDTINPNSEKSVSLLLIGKLLTERSFNVEAFKRTITTVWAPIHGLVIRALRPNLFAFQFFHWRDMMKVLDGRPWNFDNMLVLLKEADGDEPPDQVTLNQSPFWVRLKNLPFNMRSDNVVKALIGNMGDIIEIEEDVLGFGRFRRVKVMLDISKPLRRYRKLRDKKGSEIQIDFAYERLPYFCLACGVMGHSEKDCQFVFEEDKCEKLGWHLGLKATPRKGRSKELEEEKNFKNCKKVLFEAGNPSNNIVKHGDCTPPLSKSPGRILEQGSQSFVFSKTLPVGELGDKESESNKDSTVVSAPHAFIPQEFSTKAAPPPSINEVSVTINEVRPIDFVFSSSKKVSGGERVKGWKRLARGLMEEKGASTSVDFDTPMRDPKRQIGCVNMVVDHDEGTVKRLKSSPSTDFAASFRAEVGDDQPRQAL